MSNPENDCPERPDDEIEDAQTASPLEESFSSSDLSAGLAAAFGARPSAGDTPARRAAQYTAGAIIGDKYRLLNVNLDTTSGGYAGTVLSAITGNNPSTRLWSNATVATYSNDTELSLLYSVGNSRPTVVSTTNAPNRDTTLFASNHVYMVVAVTITGYTAIPGTNLFVIPQYSVTLYNPHGVDNRAVGTNATARSSGVNSDGLITISGAEFKRSFGEITFA